MKKEIEERLSDYIKDNDEIFEIDAEDLILREPRIPAENNKTYFAAAISCAAVFMLVFSVFMLNLNGIINLIPDVNSESNGNSERGYPISEKESYYSNQVSETQENSSEAESSSGTAIIEGYKDMINGIPLYVDYENDYNNKHDSNYNGKSIITLDKWDSFDKIDPIDNIFISYEGNLYDLMIFDVYSDDGVNYYYNDFIYALDSLSNGFILKYPTGVKSGSKYEAVTFSIGEDKYSDDKINVTYLIYHNEQDGTVNISKQEILNIPNKDERLYDENITETTDLINNAKLIVDSRSENSLNNVISVIFNDSGEEYPLLNSSYNYLLEISPAKGKLAYIDIFEFEEIGKVFLFDTAKKEKIEIPIENKKSDYKPYGIKWLDDENLLIIVGYAYGTITRGGYVYCYNTTTNTGKNVFTSEENIDVEYIKISDGYVELLMCKYYNNLIDNIWYIRRFKYDEVCNLFANGETYILNDVYILHN